VESGVIAHSLFPLATMQECSLGEANDLLVAWDHKMGALERGVTAYGCQGQYVLLHEGSAIAVATHSTLIRDHVGGGLNHMLRDESIELSRLCAARPGLCRVMLRLWRELVFPTIERRYAISYQDADLHNGNTYRFDGWHRSPEKSRSGTDARTGTKGRDKWIWWWELASADAEERVELNRADWADGVRYLAAAEESSDVPMLFDLVSEPSEDVA
jgi:hypothetical protein